MEQGFPRRSGSEFHKLTQDTGTEPMTGRRIIEGTEHKAGKHPHAAESPRLTGPCTADLARCPGLLKADKGKADPLGALPGMIRPEVGVVARPAATMARSYAARRELAGRERLAATDADSRVFSRGWHGRKEIYETLHPGTKHGGAPGKKGGGKKTKDAKSASFASFTEDTAAKTGRSQRSIQEEGMGKAFVPLSNPTKPERHGKRWNVLDEWELHRKPLLWVLAFPPMPSLTGFGDGLDKLYRGWKSVG